MTSSERQRTATPEENTTPFAMLTRLVATLTLVTVGAWSAVLVISLGVGMVMAIRMERPERLAEGSAAPAFTLPTLYDTNVQRSLSDYRGKPVLIAFWSSQSAPATTNLLLLEELQQALVDRELRVIAIALEAPQDVTRVQGIARRLAPSVEHLIDTMGVYQAYRVANLPEWFLVDRDGRISGRGNVPTPSIEAVRSAIAT
jgi:peroxiredoxin